MSEPDLPSRNLVVCCDGTGNVWGNSRDTNVVKLARACVKDDQQIIYYDPGVGTASGFPPVSWIDQLMFRARLLLGLAFGGGIYENISSAYGFLVDNYRPGDRVFLFGFSRGAFTARSVSGMVNLFGIVRRAGEVMIPTLLRIYFAPRDERNQRGQTREDLAKDIRENFTDPAGHEARVYFIGVWDTVATVGGLRSRSISSDISTANKRFDHVRHAVSEHEYRQTYEPRLYGGVNQAEPSTLPGPAGKPEYRPSLKQLRFAGVHSDVGGSYAEAGLSDVTLQWMLDEAEPLGLRLRAGARHVLQPDPFGCMHDPMFSGFTGPWWALTGLQRRPVVTDDLRHESLIRREASPERGSTTWRPLWTNPVFLVPLLAFIALATVIGWVTSQISLPQHTGAWDLARLQLFAAGADPNRAANYAGDIGVALWLDVILIGIYTHLLCVGCVYTVRRLRNWKADSPAAHRTLRWLLWLPLLAAPIADLAENALTCWYVASPRVGNALLLSTASAVKWTSLCLLLAVFLLGGVKGMPPNERSVHV